MKKITTTVIMALLVCIVSNADNPPNDPNIPSGNELPEGTHIIRRSPIHKSYSIGYDEGVLYIICPPTAEKSYVLVTDIETANSIEFPIDLSNGDIEVCCALTNGEYLIEIVSGESYYYDIIEIHDCI